MKEIKKAFLQLENETMSDSKKQEIFDRIVDEHKKHSKTKRNIFAIAAPLAAAALIAIGVFVLPGVFSPKQQTDQMVILPRPTEQIEQAWAAASQQSGVVSTIVLSLNPTVEFGLDSSGEVLSVQGLDEDGEQLLAGMDLNGLSLENATIVVVNQMILQDYISTDMDEDITVSIESEVLGLETLDVVTDTIVTAVSQHNIAVDVVSSEENQQLQIVLTSEEDESEAEQNPQTNDSMTVQFQIDVMDNSVVTNVSAFTEENDRLITTVDFVGLRFTESVLYGINDLISRGHITDQQPDKKMIVTLDAADAEKADVLASLTGLMIDEAGLALDIVDLEDDMGFELVVVSKQTAPLGKFTISDLLDETVHKSIEELSDLQMDILKLVYTSEQIEAMMVPRYWVVVPSLIGLSEEKAVELLEHMGILPVVTREYSEQYVQFEEGEVFFQDASAGAMFEKGQRFQVFVVKREVSPLGEGWQRSNYEDPQLPRPVQMKTEYAVYQTGVQSLYIEIANNMSEDVEFGEDFILEKLYEGTWYRDVCDIELESITKTLAPGRTVGEKIDIVCLEGAFEDGQYRILKNIGGEMYSAQFTIAADGGYDDEKLSGYRPLSELVHGYSIEAAIANGDFSFDSSGTVYNQERMVSFIEKASKGIPCKVRITRITIEGDAVIEDFTFNGDYFVVERDESRDIYGNNEFLRINYSYMTIGYDHGQEHILLSNSYEHQPLRGDGTIDYSYVLISDTSIVTDATLTETVELMMDQDDPQKVYSPDGRSFVSYIGGEKNVMYEVKGKTEQYGSGIILPEDSGEIEQVLEMKWADNSRVVITFVTDQGVHSRIAFDVAQEVLVPLSEEEQSTVEAIEQDYFDSEDAALMREAFFGEASTFKFVIGEFGIYDTYEIKDMTLVTLPSGENGQAQTVTQILDEAQWRAFIDEVSACNVYDWHRTYMDLYVMDEMQWSLEIRGENDAIVCRGSNMYPQDFDALLAVVSKYFGVQMW